ncbi:MAG: lysophospholipid acyltransferase family protein [Casimicrobiaceae bacterium]
MTDRSHRVSRARQSLRAWRMAMHLLRGLAITTFLFPFAPAARRRCHIRRWSSQLLQLLGVTPRVSGRLAGRAGNVVFVLNHVSWLDIFVLDSCVPARFVAKAELARWPLAGKLVRDTGTIFIERTRRADMARVNALASAALSQGDCLAVFPEGTCSDGTTLLKFHGSLLQPVIDSRGDMQPVALRYAYVDGSQSLAPQYAGDTSFVQSFWSVCGARGLVVEIVADAAVPAQHHSRRELASIAENAIRNALGAKVPPATRTAPGTIAGYRDRPQ